MGLIGRAIFRETFSATVLGTLLFTFVLFLRSAGLLFELLVRSSAAPSTVGYLFALAIPTVLIYTVPIGLLVGLLVCLARMSRDGEITAMRAAGLPGRRVMPPVVVLTLVAVAGTACCSLWLTPWSFRETNRIAQRLAAEQLTADIQPRVFQEQFPNFILFVEDVIPGTVVRWKNVFLADLRPAGERHSSAREAGEGPPVMVAREAIAIPDSAHNRIQLSMIDGGTNEAGKDPRDYYYTSFPRREQILEAEQPKGPPSRPARGTDTLPLIRLAQTSVDARVELHQRFAMPLACLLLALVGIPIGVSSKKAGRSMAVVTTVFLAFLYYTGLISLISLAKQGTLPVEVAVWTPNVVLAVMGILLLARLERPGEGRDVKALVAGWLEARYRQLRALSPRAQPLRRLNSRAGLFPILPQIVDTYILSSFLSYFGIFLVSFVLLTEVYTFFELLSDIIVNKIPMSTVLEYLFFLAPMLIYNSTSMAALVAVLVTFGVMTSHNEILAFKSCGVSLYRLSVPVILTSLLLSVSLFAFDYYYLPEANRRQDALRAEIKGRPVQTYQRPERPWIRGQGSRIYHYGYFDSSKGEMGGVSVYELDPSSFRLIRHISAERANWSNSLKTWVFENGWRRDLEGAKEKGFEPFQTATFKELEEPPSYFHREVKQDKQMNFQELADYIAELQQSGFDTVQLRIEYFKKFSVPLFVLILAMISVPFAFLTGNRGALAGVGVSLGIAVAYWSLNLLFEQIGNINQLPPAAAAWAPNAVFFLAAVYLMTRMRT